MYKDPEKQRENVRKSVARLRKNKVISEYNSDIWLNEQEMVADESLVKACEKGNSSALRIYYQRTQKLLDKKEETIKYEPSPDEYIRLAQRVVQGLKDSCRETGGVCPICGFGQALYDAPRLDTEREHEEDGEVAALAVST